MQSQLPPTLSDTSPVANGLALKRDPIGFFTRLAREAGDFAHYRINEGIVYFVNDPGLIRDILLTSGEKFAKWQGTPGSRMVFGKGLLGSEGELHRAMRKVAQPAFQQGRMAGYATRMVDLVDSRQKHWLDDGEVDLSREMSGVTLEIVSQLLFSVSLHDRADGMIDSVDVMQQLAERFGAAPADDRRFLQANARLVSVVRELLDDRRNSPRQSGDLFDLLLSSPGPGGAPTSDEQIMEEVRTFLLAGHVTTAAALACALWLLSRHPDEARALDEELAGVLEGRAPRFDDIPKLQRCEMILLEVLRLYPLVWILGREAVQETTLGGCILPKGALVLVCPWVLHREPQRFPEPDRFLPGRWKDGARALLPRGAYVPFSAGERSCLGERFAMMEGILLLARLCQLWKFEPLGDHPDPDWTPLVTLRARRGVRLRAVRRPSAHVSIS